MIRISTRFNTGLLTIPSIIIVLLAAFVSIIGVVSPHTVYPGGLRDSFVPNDVVNLVLGVPCLLVSLILARRRNLIGLLCWPGAVFYIFYVYIPYLLSLPYNVLFIPYLLLTSLSLFTVIGTVAAIDGEAVKRILSERGPVKPAGGILIGLAVLIIIRQMILMVAAIGKKTSVAPQELALWIDDFVFAAPAILIGGFLLWKEKPLGFAVAPGLLLVYGILSLGLVPFIIIQAHLQESSVDLIGIIVLLVMAALCLIPLALFVRAAVNKQKEE